MRAIELKVARIGNSRGVRIPARTLARYGIGATVLMEERTDGILLRPGGTDATKLTWDETALAMAAAGEDWGEWETTVADGLASVPWQPGSSRRVAERRTRDPARRPRRKP